MNTTRLLDSFPPATSETWQKIAQAEIGDLPLEQLISPSAEGIDRQPIYWPQDTQGLPAINTLPGQLPFLRGTHARHPVDGPWLICQSIRAADPIAANQVIHSALQRGATALNIVVDTPASLAQLLAHVDCSAITIFLNCAPEHMPAITTELGAIAGKQTIDLRGGIGSTIYAATTVVAVSTWQALASTTAWANQHAPQMATLYADGSAFHEAGADAIKELGYTLADAVTQIRTLTEHGLTPHQTIPHMRFSFAIGTQVFMEIAKLRAARILWSQIATAFGADTTHAYAQIHARSAVRGRSETEPHTNLLRGTVAAFAAILGGVDSLEITPFDAGFRMPDPFSLRMALNTQHLLHEESQFGQVIDPAGGSWYIESLTDQLACKAWAFFQELEANGQP